MTNATLMMSALGDPSRQAIIDCLSDGPRPVGELAALLPLSRPAVSQHLKVLKDVGLVLDRKDGTRRLYQVDPEGIAVVRAHLDQFWRRSLAAFQQVAESSSASPDAAREQQDPTERNPRS